MSVFGRGLARLCAVVAAATARESRVLVERALSETPTVELRLDWLANDRERRALLKWLKRAARKKAVFVATCRRRAGGGKFPGSARRELFWLAQAAQAGCVWCDLEIETLREFPGEALDGSKLPKILLSIHDFKGTPKLRFMRLAERSGIHAVKIAARSRTLAASARLLRSAGGRKNLVAVPMGDVGLPARILALRQGSALVYAPVGAPTAPGQVDLREMKELYRAHQLTDKTRVYGVIGNPIGHTLSPLLHNTGYVLANKDAVFLPFLVKDLGDFLKFAGDFGVRGFSVTIPLKQRIFDYLDACEPLAEEIAAVNTVTIRRDGKLMGRNTDYLGVLEAFKGKLRLPGSRVLIYGAGGAARAAAFALARSGAEVVVSARRDSAASKLARAVHGSVMKRAWLRREKFDAIVNATPIGMHPYEQRSPLEVSELNCAVVLDLIYRPLKTTLLRLAQSRGVETVSGVEMFLAQGIAQWELWMKTPAPANAMRQAVLSALQAEEKRQTK